RIAVSAWDVEDGLLFTAEEEGATLAVDPDGVVEMDDVHRRHLAVEVLEIGTHAHDVAVDRRLLVLRNRDQLNRVLPRKDLDRRRPEMQMLDAGLVRPCPGHRRLATTGGGTRGRRENNEHADSSEQRGGHAGRVCKATGASAFALDQRPI